MTDPELERAWRAAEPPSGFPDRVLDQLAREPALAEPAARRTRWIGSRARLRWGVMGAVALALVLCGVLLRSLVQPAPGGDVIAAEPREVALGERAVAEMSSGAHIRWSRDGGRRTSGIEVHQARGAVTYRVEPGVRFRVHTQHGNVAALGTVFQVVLDGASEAKGEAMKKRWAIAGATATLGALLFVSVEQGSVRLSNGRGEAIVGAGQSGAIGADGVPRRVNEAAGAAAMPAEATPPAPHEPPASSRAGARRPTPEAERLRERVLDSLRARSGKSATPEDTRASSSAAQYAPGTMVDRTGELSPETMRVLNHEFIPLVAECYDQALERKPRLRGMLAVNLELADAEEVGSIIETVQPAPDRNQIDDEELIECVRQSAFSIELPMPAKSGRMSRQLTIPLGEPLTPDAGR